MPQNNLIVVADGGEVRIDTYLAQQFPDKTRSHFKKLLQEEQVFVNGKSVRANYKVKNGDEIFVKEPPLRSLDLAAEDLPLHILYEDADLAVIDKPKGMVVHPAVGNMEHTLVNALMYHIKDLSGINGELRPGIVHRLDKDTSGLLLIAKNDKAHVELSRQIKEKTAKRNYLAIVHGNIRQDAFTVDKPIARHRTDRKKMDIRPDGRPAVTHFTVQERFGEYTLVKASLETGRTHQIRVHLKSVGHPVAGDQVYGPKKPALTEMGQLLHAGEITFVHPTTLQTMTFETPPDKEFLRVLEILRKKKR